MFGGSYVGATQMLAAIAHPPHLAGICPVVTASNYHENWTYQGGAFEQWFNQSWTSGLAQDTFDRQLVKNTNALGGMWKAAAGTLSAVQFRQPTARRRATATLAPVFRGLAGPSHLRRLLEAACRSKSTFARYHRPDADRGRLVRHLPGRIAAQLHGHQSAWRQRCGRKRPASLRDHRRPRRQRAERSATSTLAAAADFDEDEVTLKWYDYLV